MTEMNRIQVAIEDMETSLVGIAEDTLVVLEANCALETGEHFQYQEWQARAHAGGRLSLKEANLIYRSLGEAQSPDNGGWQPGVTLAAKLAITRAMAELGVPA